eukprot:CAMPEP_0179892806 /NCGR_PEP_ID=MMETSP0982-20121206/34434_1 /TAXON_ID=483367 /ORGANISM="non described non described, Strain CCMP 2436" /LENGTH=64 /DNA_ID=CAMNT_0021789325 /DNA_START=59 /DNA_END=249 /DNA_ORIENTATION=+
MSTRPLSAKLMARSASAAPVSASTAGKRTRSARVSLMPKGSASVTSVCSRMSWRVLRFSRAMLL